MVCSLNLFHRVMYMGVACENSLFEALLEVLYSCSLWESEWHYKLQFYETYTTCPATLVYVQLLLFGTSCTCLGPVAPGLRTCVYPVSVVDVRFMACCFASLDSVALN